MKRLRRGANIAGGVAIAALLAYWGYAFGGAEGRMRRLCAEIVPGMPVAQLRALADARGVRPPQSDSGVNYLVETKSFGRWGCKVTLENGVVKTSEYDFAD